MKKGIVVKQRHRYTIVLDRNGRFNKIKPIKNVELGEEVNFQLQDKGRFHTVFFLQQKLKHKVNIIAMVMVLMILTLPLYAWYDEPSAYAFVSIDINPSLELELDENMVVQGVYPLNQDAEDMLFNLSSLEGESIENATDIIINTIREQDKNVDANTVIIGVSYLEKPKSNNNVTKVLDNYFIDDSNSDFEIATFVIPEEIRKQAQKSKTSMNKIMASSLEAEEVTLSEKENMNRKEEELIQSFYNHNEATDTIDNNQTELPSKPTEVQMQTEVIEEDSLKVEDVLIDKKEKVVDSPGKSIDEKIDQVMENRANDKIPPGLEKKLNGDKNSKGKKEKTSAN
ncbi:anti-sigma-I factor RsgI family protein [Aquibacillus rhizosphaerae]|uniref:RsgI N-terminal anti-sigma domain-containing protein n=1 Tax=Aquibacillus rhizosphaerae TaxID=3051431 RepID=A0ABT7L734_9BACI|nr:hypothetical protein [Aquibacillus sp. LR5S19]MDL4840426.1 hypothetical protein [Aquibacillus sp. LR5S19]